jgi:putative ABC transport system permease protein
MPIRTYLGNLWRGWFRARQMDADLDEELRVYFEELAARYRAAGLSPDEARRAATREMGGVPRVKEATRDAWLIARWELPLHDLGQAWRGLARTPGPSALAIVTFALGIAGVASIFSVVNAALLTPLPYTQPSELVFVWSDMTASAYPRAPLSGPELNDLRTRTTVFNEFAAVWASTGTLSENGEPEQIRVGLVSTNLFPLLGVRAGVGRVFDRSDEHQAPPVSILLTWPLWQRRFGGDRSIVGTAIQVNDRLVRVAGVLPENFRLLLPPDAGIPDALDAYQLFDPRFIDGPRGQQYLRVIGRMRAGVTIEQARQDIDGVARRISREFTEYGADGRRFVTVGLASDNVRDLRTPLLVLMTGVVVLLLIAAVNVLGILVARAAARRREMAVRIALGAGLDRILRLSLAEGLTLAAIGAGAGLMLASGALRILLALRPPALSRLAAAPIDWRVLAATSAAAVLWGALFALAPLAEFFGANVAAAVGDARSGTLPPPGAGRRSRVFRIRTRSVLVVLQIALTATLMITAGLLTRTFLNILAIDPGFRSAGVLTFRIPAATPRNRNPAAVNQLARQVEQSLRHIPGVSNVGAVSHLPYDTIPNWGGLYSPLKAPAGALPLADYRAVSPGFFETAQIALTSGRPFSESDDQTGQPVAIVDDLLASRTWPGQSALGRRLFADPGSTGSPNTEVTVVGVVRHVRYRSLVDPLSEQIYFPLRQVFRSPVAYLLRTGGNPAGLTAAVRQAVSGVDSHLPVFDAQPLQVSVDRARSLQRFTMMLIVVFAAIAAVLASVGVYGVIAYQVVQRRREYGIRLALGATRGHIVRLVVGEGMVLAAVGAVLGVAGAIGAGGWLTAQLFDITPHDAVTVCVAVPLLLGAALLASWLPARRATHMAPLDALR